MALPSILRVRRRTPAEKGERTSPSPAPGPKEQPAEDAGTETPPAAAEGSTTATTTITDKAALKRATRMRKFFAISASTAYLISLIFLILVS